MLPRRWQRDSQRHGLGPPESEIHRWCAGSVRSFVVPNERELTSSTDLTEYAIEFAIDDEVPLVLPLDGPGFARRYPLPLAHGAESSAASGTFAGCSGDGIELDTIIDRATVGLEQSDDRASRVSPGRRIVSIDLALTNSNDDQVNCKELILWPTFDLVVDGATVPAFRYDTSPVEANATVVLELEFDIPAGANRLELTGGSDRTTLAAWDVELPLAAGELGQDGPRQPMIGVGPAPARPTLSPSPDERLHVERSSGGAAGSVLGADFVVGTSVAANVAIETLASPSGGERDELGRTWLAVDVRIDATADSRWSLDPTAVVLEDPTGRPHAVIDRFEDGDRLNTPTRFDGPETFQQRFIFETDGIVDDVTGWTLVVEPADVIALRLPLVGDVAVEWPRSLSAGASRDFSVGSYGGCTSTDGDEINATVVDAALDIERRNPFDDLRRVLPGHRYLRVDLDLTNLVPAPAVFDSTTANCGAAILWPSYLVRADGRFLQAFSTVDRALIDYGTTERETVVFQIPADTQVVELYAGVDPTLIAGWQLKDSVEVLTDFGATEADEQTLVTLDERVLFAFGSAELTDDAIAPLTRLAAVLIEDSVGEVVITGHTDSIGDDESNDQLSLDRAAAVVDFLVEAGVDLNRLSAVGAGEAWPVAPNQHEDGSDDPIGRAMNRRVELLFTTAT